MNPFFNEDSVDFSMRDEESEAEKIWAEQEAKVKEEAKNRRNATFTYKSDHFIDWDEVEDQDDSDALLKMLDELFANLDYQDVSICSLAAGSGKLSKAWWTEHMHTDAQRYWNDKWKCISMLRLRIEATKWKANIMFMKSGQTLKEVLLFQGKGNCVKDGASYDYVVDESKFKAVEVDQTLINHQMMFRAVGSDQRVKEEQGGLMVLKDARAHNPLSADLGMDERKAAPTLVPNIKGAFKSIFNGYFHAVKDEIASSIGIDRSKHVYLNRPSLPHIPVNDLPLIGLDSWVASPMTPGLSANASGFVKRLAWYGTGPMKSEWVLASFLHTIVDYGIVPKDSKVAGKLKEGIFAWLSGVHPLRWATMNKGALPPDAFLDGHRILYEDFAQSFVDAKIVVHPQVQHISRIIRDGMLIGLPCFEKTLIDTFVEQLMMFRVTMMITLGPTPYLWLRLGKGNGMEVQAFNFFRQSISSIALRLTLRNAELVLRGEEPALCYQVAAKLTPSAGKSKMMVRFVPVPLKLMKVKYVVSEESLNRPASGLNYEFEFV